MHKKELTYSQAIEKVMIDNGGYASLQHIYANLEKYRKKTGKTPNDSIACEVQKKDIFTRISSGVWGLTEFIEDIEENNLGYFSNKNNQIIFIENKEIITTEKRVNQTVRVGQNSFRKKLLEELKKCPITQIDDERLLIASHIKPWMHSNNEERLNSKNGFLLSPLYDKLFDKGIGLITFTSQKEILLSPKLSKENIERLGVTHGQIIDDLPISGREEFLEYHGKYIFQGK